MMAAAVECGRN